MKEHNDEWIEDKKPLKKSKEKKSKGRHQPKEED